MDRPYGMTSQIVRKLMLYRSVIRHAQIRYVLSYDWVRSIIYRRTWHSMGVCTPVESWSDSHSFNDQRRGRSKPFKDERSDAEYVKIEHCTRKRRYILWYWMSDPRKARSSTGCFRLVELLWLTPEVNSLNLKARVRLEFTVLKVRV